MVSPFFMFKQFLIVVSNEGVLQMCLLLYLSMPVLRVLFPTRRGYRLMCRVS